MSAPLNPLSIQLIAKTSYVILLKDDLGRLTLLADPGMNRPWSSRNKRLADFHAKECDGAAYTWDDAFHLLLKEHPGFEKELHERIARTATDITENFVRQRKPKGSTGV